MKSKALKKVSLFTSLILSSFLFVAMAQTTLNGKIVDEEGVPLIGATIQEKETNLGTVSDFYGNFELTTSASFPITLEVSYIGYTTQTLEVTSTDELSIALALGNPFDEVIITASRRAEKLQEAPAAVSVISARETSQSGGSLTPVRALINVPGIELQQQTGQRINIAFRGGSGIFSTQVFPMLDFRSLISPGIEYFDSQNSPINNIDIERIETVLGPSSALYGPDVASGVVHFMSKDPFRHPGTTVEGIAGELRTKQIAIRHAAHSSTGKFGYKINARYGEGHDFVLDPNDPEDQEVLSNFLPDIYRATITADGNVDSQVPGEKLLSPGTEQIPDYWSAMTSASLYFRPNQNLEIVTAGGWNASEAVFYQDLGEGFYASNEYWAQARLNSKNWFAQTYYISNDGGSDKNPTYLNRTGLIVPLKREHFEAQFQYRFDLDFLNSEWTTGIDYRLALSNTQNHVYGRNEDNDDYRIFGGYTQAKFKPADKLDIFLATRFDTYNFTNETTFSPRVAFVYRPHQDHNFRLTYNKAPNPIPASDIYFDLPVQSIPGVADIWVMGAIDEYTFSQNPEIEWLIPGVPATPYAAGFPLDAAYAFVNDGVIAQIQQLSADPNYAPLVPLLTSLLADNTPGGFSSVSGRTIGNEDELLPESKSGVLITDISAYELGYKGLFFDKLVAGFNVYYTEQTSGGGFTQVSPVVYLDNLATDLGSQVQAYYEPLLEQALIANGFDAATAAATAAATGPLLNDAYTAGGEGFLAFLTSQGLDFHGLIETEQAANLSVPQLIYGYPTVDPNAISSDWGFEFFTKYHFTNRTKGFLNYSWFNNPSGIPGNLNFPQNKIRAGLSHENPKGLGFGTSIQWDQAYTSTNSVFPGKIDARFLVDLTLTYALNDNFTFEASATNLFNNEFRSLPGMPKIGRRAITRIVYNFN